MGLRGRQGGGTQTGEKARFRAVSGQYQGQVSGEADMAALKVGDRWRRGPTRSEEERSERVFEQAEQSWMDAAGRAYTAASQWLGAAQDVGAEYTRPSMMLKPRVSIDGDKWCALYGENLQDGVAGFGDSPAEAFADFDKAWVAKLPTKAA